MSRIFIFVILCVALVASEKIRGVRRTRNIVKRQTGGGCLYEGTVYQQGQSWTVPCKYNCVCKDGTRGQYSCTEVCPHYDTLPDGCYMQKDPNSQCCSVPKCNFQPGGSGSGGNVITGTSGGDGGGGGGGTPVLQMGSGSGHSGSFMSGGTCHDTANNCVNYGQAVCSDPQYSQWVKQNCAKFCNVCGGTSGGAGVISGGGGVSGGGSGGGMVSGGGGVSGGGAGVISGGGSGGGMVSGGGGASGGGAGVISGGGSGGGMVSGGGGVSGGGTSHTDGGDGGFSLHFGTGGGSGGSGGSGIMTGTCTDAINNCAAYGTSVCSDPQYDQWVTKNCAHSCNKCGSTGTMTGGGTGTYTGTGTGTMTGTGGTGTMTGTGSCMDKSNCASFGSAICTNSAYAAFAREQCPKYCNLCSSSGGTMTGTGGTMNGGSGTMTGGGTCADKTPNCDSYGQQVCNDPTYAGWVSENCPHFCGKCSGSMTSGTGGSVYYPGGGTMTGTGGTMTGTGGTMTGTGGTMTGTGGTMTGTGGTMTGTGGSMTGTGGTMTDTGSGGTMTGTSSGCVYKHQVYQQGQTWKDGCTYSCTCTNAATGQYTCTGLCAQWNLPPSCTLNPPAAGKCCQTPNCPSNVQIQYPPGYVEQ
uniref:Loricrin-like isoform X18 n=1 Tax=Crassostrea virginica TaxID=6565 RepID=A0A8B8EK42_CRAVI|nr:loricrin-like isoform X18 [Crassostrea virginica]